MQALGLDGKSPLSALMTSVERQLADGQRKPPGEKQKAIDVLAVKQAVVRGALAHAFEDNRGAAIRAESLERVFAWVVRLCGRRALFVLGVLQGGILETPHCRRRPLRGCPQGQVCRLASRGVAGTFFQNLNTICAWATLSHQASLDSGRCWLIPGDFDRRLARVRPSLARCRP